MVPVIRAVDKLADIVGSCENFVRSMHELGQDPYQQKQLKRLFSPSEAGAMVGRDRTTLGRAEVELALTGLERNPKNGRRMGYTLEHIQAFRAHFGTLPWRDANSDPPLVVGVQNFKGGVGKSTTTVNLAHYLALKGYRVLVVDTDSQATTTSMFGYVPDAEIDQSNTVLPYLEGEQRTLDYAVRRTYFPNIDLIPACLALYEAEISIVMHVARQDDPAQRRNYFSELRYGLDTVADHYDFVLIDSPPALGMISISVLLAADCLLVPMAPKMFDFSSTAQFFRMVQDYIGRIDPDKSYRWISVLTTLYDRRYVSQKQFVDVMRECFADAMFQRVFFHSSGLLNGAVEYTTPYEQAPPDRAVLGMMDSVFEEIEIALLREWPSKQTELQGRAVA